MKQYINSLDSRFVHIFTIEKNKTKAVAFRNSFLIGIRRRPTLPGRFQPSTIGAERLNFCVRDGYRWCPLAIVTGNCMYMWAGRLSRSFPLRNRFSRFFYVKPLFFRLRWKTYMWTGLSSGVFRKSGIAIAILLYKFHGVFRPFGRNFIC